MSSQDDKCASCSSHTSKQGLLCNLSPIYAGLQCPCLTCLVILTCNANDEECDRYYEFGKEQGFDRKSK